MKEPFGPAHVLAICLFIMILVAALVPSSGAAEPVSSPTIVVEPQSTSKNAIDDITETPAYPLASTGQTACYDDEGNEIDYPAEGEPFYGQDAQFAKNGFSFTDNGDGTVTDHVTGLVWQQSPSTTTYSWEQAQDYCESLTLGGREDWRMPTLKELFSISDFSQGWPYLDLTYFDLVNESNISKDEQYWADNHYVGYTSEGRYDAAFGVNHATGHIKAYPASVTGPMAKYVRAVAGDTYGENEFVDNGDGTITDEATSLMWMQADSGQGMNWEAALAYAQSQNDACYLGYNDWRLPNVKELQSIVDYGYAPDSQDPAYDGPALDPMFDVSGITNEAGNADYPYYWSSTSARFQSGGDYYYAWYVAAGRAVDGEGNDTHGAGAVRFDTKAEGGPAGEGGERYDNYVRLVRDAERSDSEKAPTELPQSPHTPSPTQEPEPTTTALPVETPAYQSYPIVDTNQSTCFDVDGQPYVCPSTGDALYGQDAQFAGNAPNYADNHDGTVTDNVTGIVWQKTADTDGDGDIQANDKLTYDQAVAYCDNLTLAGYDDWRLPSIKQLYSLIAFSGIDPSGYEGTDTSGLVPFIDDSVFEFAYGDTVSGERVIDSQYASSTLYAANDTNAMVEDLLFGVNFADGRIKGYGLSLMGNEKTFCVQCARMAKEYGENDLVNQGDGTIIDSATDLMWSQDDSGVGMDWYEALAWVDSMNDADYLGYNDWRLPNAKVLQSIVDYDRSPDTTGSAAIDPAFDVTAITNEAGETDYPYFWSSTTHENWTNVPGGNAVYVSFGRAMGYMNDHWVDVHGAGAQRSDPKSGDPADYPTGHGPQGDAIRIDNYVRLVRDADGTASTHDISLSLPWIVNTGLDS